MSHAKIEKLQQQDASGVIDMVLEMIDAYVENKPWLRIIWRYVRAALVGNLPPLPETEAEKATALDGLIEIVLGIIDTYVEQSGRPLLKMLWRIIRAQMTPQGIAQAVQAG